MTDLMQLIDDYADWHARHAADHCVQSDLDEPNYSATPEIYATRTRILLALGTLQDAWGQGFRGGKALMEWVNSLPGTRLKPEQIEALAVANDIYMYPRQCDVIAFAHAVIAADRAADAPRNTGVDFGDDSYRRTATQRGPA